MRRAIKARNADRLRLAGNPLDAITREKATFTTSDIAYALRRATDLERDDDDS